MSFSVLPYHLQQCVFSYWSLEKELMYRFDHSGRYPRGMYQIGFTMISKDLAEEAKRFPYNRTMYRMWLDQEKPDMKIGRFRAGMYDELCKAIRARRERKGIYD